MVCSEDQCAVCARWSAAERKGMRMLIDYIPRKEPMCKECVMAWWRNLIEITEPTTRH